MKNLLLMLLLANILYFMWSWYVEDAEEPGVAVIEETELGPPLTVNPPSESGMTGDAAYETGKAAELPAQPESTCVTIGPFYAAEAAAETLAWYTETNVRSALRKEEGQIFLGHWVQLRDVPSRNESNRMIRALKKGGIKDAYPVETEDEGRKISLGLFQSMDSARTVEKQAKDLGFEPDIAPRTRDSELFFVDVNLPPGQGTGDIIELYGEDKVHQGGNAACPPE